MLASPTSRWTAGAVLLTVLILVASWFLLISPRRTDATAVRDQVMSAQSQASALQLQISQLKAQFADLPTKKAELAAIKEQLPATGDVPALVRNLQDYASAAGVDLQAITPSSPTIYSAGGTSNTAATMTAEPGSVVTIPVTISVSGDYFEDALFVKSLQTKLKRAILITGVATDLAQQTAATGVTTDTTTATATPAVAATPAAGTATTDVSLQLTTSIFVMVDETTVLKELGDQAKAAAAKAGTPAATATAQASAAANS